MVTAKIVAKIIQKFRAQPLFYKLLLLYFLVAMAIFGQGVYIKIKAQVAQVLLEIAWNQQQQDYLPHKAWLWADGHPLAKITITQQQPLIILTGGSGSNLAFTPSWLASSSLFDRGGNSVVLPIMIRIQSF
jgi:sortase A